MRFILKEQKNENFLLKPTPVSAVLVTRGAAGDDGGATELVGTRCLDTSMTPSQGKRRDGLETKKWLGKWGRGGRR